MWSGHAKAPVNCGLLGFPTPHLYVASEWPSSGGLIHSEAVRVSQRRTRHLASESQMVQLAFDRMQARLDVAQTFPIG
jgi:hypothetical protein